MGTTDFEQAELVRLRRELDAVKTALADASNMREYFRITETALNIAKDAAYAATPQHDQDTAMASEPSSLATAPMPAAPPARSATPTPLPPPPAAAAAPAPMPAAAPVAASSTLDVHITHVAAGWSSARLQAFIERTGVRPASVSKQVGQEHGQATFASEKDRSKAVAELDGLRLVGQTTMYVTVPMVLPPAPAALPAAPSTLPAAPAAVAAAAPGAVPAAPVAAPTPAPAAAAASGTKRPASAADDRQKQQHQDERGQWGRDGPAAKKARPQDVRDVVCPLYATPYSQQLDMKLQTVTKTLGQVTRMVRAVLRNKKGASFPAWLTAAASRMDQSPVPSTAITRSPSLEQYRNKSDFTIGLDAARQIAVGFKLGSYADGITSIGDPKDCRHISGTALSYAALLQTFLRTHSKLPVWDAKSNAGFWRLLLVREGREVMWAPVPGAEPVAAGTALTALPMEKWLVRAGPAPEGEEAGMQLHEVTEEEPAAPSPDEALVMLQVDPRGVAPDTIAAEVNALAAFLQEEAKSTGLPMTWLLLQLHSAFSSAGAWGAPLIQLPMDPSAMEAEGPAAQQAQQQGQQRQQGQQQGQELGCLTDTLGEFKFRISPMAFFQTNSAASAQLYRVAGDWAAPGPETLLLDVCCGTGSIGITLARRCKTVVGVDNIEAAIQDARANAALNGISNATWVCKTAEAALGDILAQHAAGHQEVVAIVDPPRAGLHKGALRALVACEAVRRLVYVSCNPDSCAKNVAALCCPELLDDKGKAPRWGKPSTAAAASVASCTPFHPVKAQAFDMFPHTKHVECIMLLER